MKKKFKGKIKKLESEGGDNAGGLGWRVVDVPFDVKKIFGKAGRVPITGSVNGVPIRTSLFPRKGGPHFLLMNKAMQKSAGVTSLGDTVTVEIELDTKERTVTIPTLLKKILAQEELLDYYNEFSYSMRKYFGEYVTSAKSETTRVKRAEHVAEMLIETRDGEKEPPPILAAEFRRNPKAKEGWDKMTLAQKRSHLRGIAYYSNPEAKARRAAKAVREMVAYAEKRKK